MLRIENFYFYLIMNLPTQDCFSLNFEHDGGQIIADVSPKMTNTKEGIKCSGDFIVKIKGNTPGVHRLIFARNKDTGQWVNITLLTSINVSILELIADGITKYCSQ